MSEREAFGPNLRRARLARGVSLEQLVASTNVSLSLWEGLERNDFSRWPTGIHARSFIRDYARAVGADPESTVDVFCRWFPQGDRRVEPIIRGQADIVGHTLQWRDTAPASATARIRRSEAAPPVPRATEHRPLAKASWLRRAFGRA